MSIACHVEIDGVPYEPRKPFVFATLPRIGEWISLNWDQERGDYPRYTVRAIRHVPDEVEDQPAFTVLYVAKEGW